MTIKILPRPDYCIIQAEFYQFEILVSVPLTPEAELPTVCALTSITLGIGSYNFKKVGNRGNKILLSGGYIQSCLEIIKDGDLYLAVFHVYQSF